LDEGVIGLGNPAGANGLPGTISLPDPLHTVQENNGFCRNYPVKNPGFFQKYPCRGSGSDLRTCPEDTASAA
jgi:hypothetical protein